MSTTTDDHSVTNHPHDEIEALLPWYANGTLTVAETATVERHLAHCPACRADLEQCRALATAVQRNEESWQPAPGGFDRLMAEIDRLEAKPTPAKTGSSSLLQRILESRALDSSFGKHGGGGVAPDRRHTDAENRARIRNPVQRC